MIILKQPFQPRSSPLNSQETKQAPHSFTFYCTVGASFFFFLVDPRKIFQFNTRQADFSSERLPLGPNHNKASERRTQKHVLLQGGRQDLLERKKNLFVEAVLFVYTES